MVVCQVQEGQVPQGQVLTLAKVVIPETQGGPWRQGQEGAGVEGVEVVGPQDQGV